MFGKQKEKIFFFENNKNESVQLEHEYESTLFNRIEILERNHTKYYIIFHDLERLKKFSYQEPKNMCS